VEGLAAVYGVTTTTGHRFHQGAFAKASAHDIEYFFRHDQGKWGTVADVLALWEVTLDELPPMVRFDHPEATGGLMVVRKYCDHENGQAARQWLHSGQIKGLSMGFIRRRTTTRHEHGQDVIDVYEGELYEISDCLEGACPGTMPVTGTHQFSLLQKGYRR